MSTAELTQWFDTLDINKSAARFDFKKLDDLNAHYLRGTDTAELVSRIRDMLPHLDFAALTALPVDSKAPARRTLLSPKRCSRSSPP